MTNKNNYIYYLLIFIITYKSYANRYGFKYTDYTINDIENFKVIINKTECPEESSYHHSIQFTSRTGEKYQSCDYQYYCHKNEKCIKVNTPYEITDPTDSGFYNDYSNFGMAWLNLEDNNKNDTLIIDSCNEISLSSEKNCKTDICLSHSDCFSKNCINHICITNPDYPSYTCRTVFENSEYKVKCLKSYEEKCEKDIECANESPCGIDNLCTLRNFKGFKNDINNTNMNNDNDNNNDNNNSNSYINNINNLNNTNTNTNNNNSSSSNAEVHNKLNSLYKVIILLITLFIL
ncbi:hypothetical protein BCR32DRAFT_290341 [Anaeromyces robustus]|uniref:Uncharacterized protein n=1 Tax=Anaeromyces robustus TaxID=1754192 RepID=A0A1Y1XJR1_9FUNG|nr:hypothetical protein BCR32DRAFT_290341 [Anaeromyces robustus]|eukprot:ORX85997.1 hypothetical protein BCR32DRAFT_290341 [Anaeromyces robustus]